MISRARPRSIIIVIIAATVAIRSLPLKTSACTRAVAISFVVVIIIVVSVGGVVGTALCCFLRFLFPTEGPRFEVINDRLATNPLRNRPFFAHSITTTSRQVVVTMMAGLAIVEVVMIAIVVVCGIVAVHSYGAVDARATPISAIAVIVIHPPMDIREACTTERKENDTMMKTTIKSGILACESFSIGGCRA